MLRISLQVTLSGAVAVLAAAVPLLGWESWQVRLAWCDDPAPCPCESCPAPPPSSYIVVVEPTQAEDDAPQLRSQLLADIRSEIERIGQLLSRLVKTLEVVSAAGRTEALIVIRERIAALIERLAAPVGGGGGGGELVVRHHIESVSKDVMADLRAALASIEIDLEVGGGGSGGCQLADLGPVGGFEVGEHWLRDEAAACGEVRLNVERQLDERVPSHLILVGRADRTPFRSPRYGGNRGLAQARAKWVHRCLLGELPHSAGRAARPLPRIDPVLKHRTVLLSAGPLNVPACPEDGDCRDAEARADDRSVDVFACLANPSLGVAAGPGQTDP